MEKISVPDQKRKTIIIDPSQATIEQLIKARDLLNEVLAERIKVLQSIINRQEKALMEQKHVSYSSKLGSPSKPDPSSKYTHPLSKSPKKSKTYETSKLVSEDISSVTYNKELQALVANCYKYRRIFSNLEKVVLIKNVEFSKLSDIESIFKTYGPIMYSYQPTATTVIFIFEDARDAKDLLNKKKYIEQNLNVNDKQIKIENGTILEPYLQSNNTDTVLVKNIPQNMLHENDIRNLMTSFGEVEAVIIRTDDNYEQMNEAYVKFKNVEDTFQFVTNSRPFSRYQGTKRNIIVEPTEHFKSKEELDEELDNYMNQGSKNF